jgi:hypothetical protein
MAEALTGGGDEGEVSMASKEWMRPARGLDSRKMRITGFEMQSDRINRIEMD